MTARQRVQAVLKGQMPDRPPVCFWHHFPANQVCGAAAVEAHVGHLRRYDLDFLKVMNDNGYPHAGRVEAVADLRSIVELRGDEEPFARQLELISALRREVGGEVPMVSTIFNPWAVLRHLVRPPVGHHPPEMEGAEDRPSQRIGQFLAEDFDAVKAALGNIGRGLAKFAKACLSAGADGIFLSVRDDWVRLPGQEGDLYAWLVKPTDLEILASASGGWFNMLHVCGRPVDFRAFAEYPVQVVNWADRAAGPSIGEVKDWLQPAICAGVDNLTTLAEGTAQACADEVASALRQAGTRPIMIAPGCTYDPQKVPVTNLQAVSRAAHAWQFRR